jgi:hypothetical protein
MTTLKLTATTLLALVCLACGSSTPTAPSAPPIAQYAGTWSGTYTVTGCTQSGGVALANVCGSLGNSPSYGFQFTQSGANVSGSFTLGTIAFPGVGGTVGADTSLAVQGTAITNGVTIVVRWALTMPGLTPSGTVTQTWTSNVLSGQATVVGTIATAGHGQTVRTTVPQSVAEALRAVR